MKEFGDLTSGPKHELGSGPTVTSPPMMQVLRCGFQIAVAEQNLNGAQVGTCIQQVSRPTVAQSIRRDAFADAGPTRSLATCNPDRFVKIG